jgi:hypothetical protein
MRFTLSDVNFGLILLYPHPLSFLLLTVVLVVSRQTLLVPLLPYQTSKVWVAMV